MPADPMTRPVITGVAASASLGTDAMTLWDRIKSGHCGIGPMTAIEPSVPTNSTGGQAPDLPNSYLPDLPREVRYLRWTLENALHDAAIDTHCGYPSTRRCIVLGTTLHGIRSGGRFLRTKDPLQLESFLAGSICQQAIEGLGIGGGSITTCSACSSSLGAIALGVTLLESDQVDLVVAGGYDAISEYSWAGFNSLRLISQHGIRPFCRDRDGMKVAEGYGLVVLEREEGARARGVRIRARIAGWGESADAYHLTQPHPHGDGALTAITQALDRAGFSPAAIDLIAAHATGTPDNDASEFQALSRVLGTDLSRVPVIGFKSFLGHTLGGAGAVELVMSCMALAEQCVPAVPHIRHSDVEYPDLNLSIGETRPSQLRITLNTSLGFGGANDCLIMTAADVASPSSVNQTTRLCPACITGVGIVLPDSIGTGPFVEFMKSCTDVTPKPSSHSIAESLLAEHIRTRRTRRLSLPVKLTLAAATMAIRDAQLDEETAKLSDACAILGSMHGPIEYCHDYYARIVEQGAGSAQPVLFAEGVPNAVSAHVSTHLGLNGSCQTIIGSMTAGLDALALAAMRVGTGATETVLVIAVEEDSQHTDQAYAIHKGESPRTIRPPGIDGSTSGAVAFVVESATTAASRKVEQYAQIMDSAWACDASAGSGGPAASIASVLRRLQNPGVVLASSHNTWIERAQRLGARRACATIDPSPARHFAGDLFSVAPLVNLAFTLINPTNYKQCTLLSTDLTGAASAISVRQGPRRLAST